MSDFENLIYGALIYASAIGLAYIVINWERILKEMGYNG